MKKISSTLIFLIVYSLSHAQTETPKGSAGKNYIFNYDVSLPECDDIGEASNSDEIIPRGSKFFITHITDDGYVIVLWDYKLPRDTTSSYYTQQLDKRERLNYKSMPKKGLSTLLREDDNVKHFFLNNDEYVKSVSELKPKGEWNYGTLVQPFKFRSHPSFFTTDLSLGAVVGYQLLQIKNTKWNVGIYGGLSLTKVTLDSLSTNGIVRTSTERPAFTPSLNLLLGYGGVFSITAGIGWDYINETSATEKSWIYQGNRWFGLGIGIKLFTPNSNKESTVQKQEQTKK